MNVNELQKQNAYFKLTYTRLYVYDIYTLYISVMLDWDEVIEEGGGVNTQAHMQAV